MRQPAMLTALGFVLLTSMARADDVLVRYLVDAKQLKAADASTALTFDTFADATCAVPLGSTVVTLGAVDLVEQVKPVKIKDDPDPEPKAAWLNHRLTGVASGTPIYLKVTGAGITAIGGDCQLQFVTVPQGPQGPPGPSLTVVDANGSVVGLFASVPGTGNVALRVVSGATTWLVWDVDVGLHSIDDTVFFESPDCTGPPLITAGVDATARYFGRTETLIGTTLYFGAFGSGVTHTVASQINGGGSSACVPTSPHPQDILVSAQSTEVGPFIAPFHIEVR